MGQEEDNIEKKEIKHTIGLPFEWALQKVFGPTLDEFGKDIRKLYEKGRDRIVNNAAGKVKPGTESQPANMRVAWETLTSGVFADSEIASEYFGGVLASSKSTNGKDDRGVYYLDIIKSLSSSQLHLHYCIYRSLNYAFCANRNNRITNLGLQNELNNKRIYFLPTELMEIGLQLDTDFNALHAEGLIQNWETNIGTFSDPRETNKQMAAPHSYVVPTTLGLQLFAVAHNRLQEWRGLASVIFEDFKDIKCPTFFGFNMRNILAKTFGKNVLQIEINKPVQQVFEFTVNPFNTPLWIDSIKEERVDKKPIGVGTIYQNTSDGADWISYICEEFKENEVFALKRKYDSYHVKYEYAPVSETRSKLVYTEWVEKGTLDDPFDSSNLQKLKTIMEEVK